MNLVDTSGWVEYFFEGSNAGFFADAIEDTQELLVPVICIYEVFKKVSLVATDELAFHTVAQMEHGRIVNITEPIALSAAGISIKHKLPMADSLILSCARTHDAILWTQDSHFHNLPGVRYKKASKSKSKK
ncbi:MAG: type II toxin-antitoxin system VapC family toxin [Candidatus Sumerlaeia bacterium]